LDANQCDAHHLLGRVQARLAVAASSTLEAIERRLEGAMSARCTLGLDGRFRDCAVVKSLPELDGAVLAALAEAEYEPATSSGRPVQIQYVFNFDFRSE